MILLEVQLDFLKYLLDKAKAAADRENLRARSERLQAVSDRIAQIESEDYVCNQGDQEHLQRWMNTLVSSYIEDPQTLDRIDRVVAVERSVGLSERR